MKSRITERRRKWMKTEDFIADQAANVLSVAVYVVSVIGMFYIAAKFIGDIMQAFS